MTKIHPSHSDCHVQNDTIWEIRFVVLFCCKVKRVIFIPNK